VACNAPETGHPSLAAWAIRWKSPSSIPGTEATVRRWMPVMPVPATNVTSALVRTEVGVVPFWSSSLDSAMEKHAECAAASNSSGLVVPEVGSVLAFQLTSKVARPDVLSSALPEPEPRSPLQELVAVVVTGVGMRSSEWSWVLCPRPSCTWRRLLAQRQAPAIRRRPLLPADVSHSRRRTPPPSSLRRRAPPPSCPTAVVPHRPYGERNVRDIMNRFTRPLSCVRQWGRWRKVAFGDGGAGQEVRRRSPPSVGRWLTRWRGAHPVAGCSAGGGANMLQQERQR